MDTARENPPNQTVAAVLRQVALASGALILAAALLIAAYVGLSPDLSRYAADASRNEIRPWILQGEDLVARMGRGEARENKSLAIVELEKGIDSRAIFTRRVRLKSTDYPFLNYQISGRHAAEHIYFIWRTAENPDTVHNILLGWSGDRTASAHLGQSPQWKGTITEVGLDVYGDLRDQPPIVRSLSLLPTSRTELIRAIWTEWTSFRLWSQKSAHHLRGTPRLNTLSPTLATAAWAGLALVVAFAITAATRSRKGLPLILTLLIPWIALDLLWQNNLSTQLDETRTLYAGKTQHEKHLAGREAMLYKYAQHIKQEVLPEPGVRIFLLHDSVLRSYRRLKAQYYLLPHNLFNFDKFPRKNALKPGDYLLVLDEIKGLDFNAETGQLEWRGQQIPVERVDSTPPGALYLYRGANG
jgi:hypothetical protein